MTALLIGDIGATGSDWVLIDGDHSRLFSLGGYNPVSQSVDRLDLLITGLANELGKRQVDICYYGAGVGIGTHTEQMRQRFIEGLNLRSIDFASDLLAAARALCSNQPGVVCILGTGSNACWYDGIRLQSGHSLGYPLGDEGSGMDIGRRLVKSFYYGLLPQEISTYVSTYLPKDRLDFLKLFKSQDAPNQFLASFTEKILTIKDEVVIQKILMEAFTDFINFHLHPIQRKSKINAVGSIAYYFCAEFEKCLAKQDLVLGKILRKPIEALAAFHLAPNNKL